MILLTTLQILINLDAMILKINIFNKNKLVTKWYKIIKNIKIIILIVIMWLYKK